MSASRVTAVLDTSVLQEFKAIDQVPWPSLLKAKEVELLVAAPVLGELDKNKVSHKPKLRDRAAKAISLLDKIFEDVQHNAPVRIGTVATIYPTHLKDEDVERRGLNPSHPDDQLMALTLQLAEAGVPVHLVTGDRGLRLRAKAMKVPVFALPEDLRLPAEEDESARELRRLKAELERKQRPILKIEAERPPNSGPLHSLGKVPDAVFIKNLRTYEFEWARERSYQAQAEVNERLALMDLNGELPEGSMLTTSEPVEIARRYMDEVARYLEALETRLKTLSKIVAVKLIVENGGNAPANDVRLTLRWKVTDELNVLSDVVALPIAPARPFGGGASQKLIDAGAGLRRVPLRYQMLASLSYDLGPKRPETDPELGECEVVELQLGKVQHGRRLELPWIYLQFAGNQGVHPISLWARLQADNLDAPVSERLDLKIEPAT